MILSENRLPLFRIMRLSPCGGTGRRARLKIVFRKEWGFDSLHGHQRCNSILILLSFFRKSPTAKKRNLTVSTSDDKLVY